MAPPTNDALAGNIFVISPHLDDAVLSLGASIGGVVRRGGDVTVLTVLAGDPSSSEPAGLWDGRAGFRTAGDAATARRKEDRRACAILGAKTVWLPYGDEQYAKGADDATVRSAVAAAVAGADAVLLPGFPLTHADHAWLTTLLIGATLSSKVGLYVEQPYSADVGGAPGLAGPLRGAISEPHWAALPASRSDRAAKGRASRAYRTQMPLLTDRRPAFLAGARVTTHIAAYEIRRGGETIAWLDDGTPG